MESTQSKAMLKCPVDCLDIVTQFVGCEIIAKSHLNKKIYHGLKYGQTYFDMWVRWYPRYRQEELVKLKLRDADCWLQVRIIERHSFEIAASAGRKLQDLILANRQLFEPLFNLYRRLSLELNCECIPEDEFGNVGPKRCFKHWDFDWDAKYPFENFKSKALFCHKDLITVYRDLGVSIQELPLSCLISGDFGSNLSPAYTNNFRIEGMYSGSFLEYSGGWVSEYIEEYIKHHYPDYDEKMIEATKCKIIEQHRQIQVNGASWNKRQHRPWE